MALDTVILSTTYCTGAGGVTKLVDPTAKRSGVVNFPARSRGRPGALTRLRFFVLMPGGVCAL